MPAIIWPPFVDVGAFTKLGRQVKEPASLTLSHMTAERLKLFATQIMR
jgi:hypothetical protein